MMQKADQIAHTIIGAVAAFASMVLAAMDAVEITLRALMDGAGISADLQTLAFITMVLTFMIAARHLLKGVTRSVVTVLLILVLAHIVSILARHGAISSLHV